MYALFHPVGKAMAAGMPPAGNPVYVTRDDIAMGDVHKTNDSLCMLIGCPPGVTLQFWQPAVVGTPSLNPEDAEV
jgi:hypothetical protein